MYDAFIKWRLEVAQIQFELKPMTVWVTMIVSPVASLYVSDRNGGSFPHGPSRAIANIYIYISCHLSFEPKTSELHMTDSFHHSTCLHSQRVNCSQPHTFFFQIGEVKTVEIRVSRLVSVHCRFQPADRHPSVWRSIWNGSVSKSSWNGSVSILVWRSIWNGSVSKSSWNGSVSIFPPHPVVG